MEDYAKTLADIIATAQKEGNAEVTIRLVFNDKKDEVCTSSETEKKISLVNEKLNQLKEKYDEVKELSTESTEEAEPACCECCDEPCGFSYEEFFSVLEDRIDDLETKITNIDENVGVMFECIPHSFDMLEERIGCSPNTKLKKKQFEKILDDMYDIKDKIINAVYDVNDRQHDEQLGRYTDLKGLLSEVKSIGLDNTINVNRLTSQLKLVLDAKYGLSENCGDKTAQEMIRDIYNMFLLSKGSAQETNEKILNAIDQIATTQATAAQSYQTVLKDIYSRQDAIDKKLDDLMDIVATLAHMGNGSVCKASTQETDDKILAAIKEVEKELPKNDPKPVTKKPATKKTAKK